MKVIWLCSWYPNREDNYRGDFIQRQALAVSSLVRADIVHVVFCDKKEKVIRELNENLTEHIFYTTKKNKILDWRTFFDIHRNFLEDYKMIHGNPDLVHVQIPLPAGIVAMWWQHRYGIPYVLTEHYGIYNDKVEDNFNKRNFLFRYYVKKIIRSAKRFLPVSESLGMEVNEMVIRKKFTAIPNVVDTGLFHFIARKPVGKFRFVHVSNMAALKNVKRIVEAMVIITQRNSNVECIFIGNQPADILAYAADQDVLNKSCFFMNEMTYEEVADQVRNCNAGVLFSTTESQSCVVLEWLCSGLPVISSAVGGVVELIHAENGLLVPSGDLQALVTAMESVIKNYAYYDGAKIAAQAAGLYSYPSVARQFINIYAEVCKSR